MTPPARKAASKAKKAATPTEYVVLEQTERNATGAESAWLPIGSATVKGNKDKAIDEVAGTREGTFKAVAASSWKGGRVKAQTTLIESKPLVEREAKGA